MASFQLPTTAVCLTDPRSVSGFGNAALLQGAMVYQNPTTKKFALARANDPITSVLAGMLLNGSGADNSPISILNGGIITGLTSIVIGEIYCLAPGTAGHIIAYSELVTGNYISIFGFGKTITSIQMALINTGLQKP